MLKVTDDKVTKSWSDFEEYLISTGIFPNKESITGAYKLAFKHGFVEGYNDANEVTPLQVSELNNVEASEKYNSAFEEQIKMKSDPKKFYPNGKNNRNLNKVINDCFYLCEYLKGSYCNVEEASTNKQIIDFMHSIDRTHWNSSNCTSFINYAINSEYPIVKVGRGLWKYKK